MGKFIEIQEARKEVKEKEKVRRETLGKFFYDLAKLSFAGLVVAWLTQMPENYYDVKNVVVLLFGISFTILFSIIGDKILK